MAQALQNNDDVKQPGASTEGDSNKSSPLYPDHKFTVVEESNSLQITIQNKKTKRVFSDSFSKETLESMKLNGSIAKIIHMIHSAKSGKTDKFQFKFDLVFGDAKNEKISSEEFQIEHMSKTYKKGHCMYMIISVDEFFMSGLWPFKLPEQKREETDILRDIIEDLQAEVVELKTRLQQPKMNPMVVWKSSAHLSNKIVSWDIESFAPTLKGLAIRENSNRDIVVGIAGCYRVSVRFGWQQPCNSSYIFNLRVNGVDIATWRCYYDIALTIVEILKLNKGDKLDFVASATSQYTSTFNSFTLELLDYGHNV
eukprot:34474_1